ncbi:MAG: O-antigen/teichoic acid export membrane protein [Psychromonas sp.]|jgi:O-antigen/teichoic acid export membrane protein
MYCHSGLTDPMLTSAIAPHQLLKKSAFLLVVKVLASLLALIFHYLLAKQLSPSQFGLFSLAMTCLMFSSVFAKQGLDQVMLRFMAKSTVDEMGKLYWIIVIYALLSACVVALLIVFGFTFMRDYSPPDEQLALLVPLIAVLTIIQTFLGINSSALNGKEHAISALLFSGLITFVVAIFLLWYAPVNSAYQALMYFTYAAVIAVVLSFIFVSAKLSPEIWQIKNGDRYDIGKNFFQIFTVSRQVLIISLAALATQQLSILILANYVSLAELAVFSLALKLSLLMSYPLMVINMITAPKYAKLYHNKKYNEFNHLAKSSTQLLFLIASLGVFLLYLTLDDILSYFGPVYLGSAVLVKILLIGQWFNLATGSSVSILLMSGHEKLHRRNTLYLTSVNIMALFIFIPVYGLMAAAIITMVAMAIKNLVSLYFVNKLIYSKTECLECVNK